MAFEVNNATASQTSFTVASKVYDGSAAPEKRPVIGKFTCDVDSPEAVFFRIISPHDSDSLGKKFDVGDSLVLSGRKTGGFNSVEVYSAAGTGKYSMTAVE
jgi:hypothetical protein